MKVIFIISIVIALSAAKPISLYDDEIPIASNFELINELNAHGTMDEAVEDRILIKRNLNEDDFFQGIYNNDNSANNNGESKIPLSQLINAIEDSLLRTSRKVVQSNNHGEGSSNQSNSVHKRELKYE